MQSTTTAGQGKGKDKGKGDGAGVNYGTGVGTSAAAKDNTKPKAHGGTGSSSIGGDSSAIAAALEDEITGRFLPRGPNNYPAKGPQRTGGSQWGGQPTPTSSNAPRSNASNAAYAGRPTATTANQPTTASGQNLKKRPK